MITGYVEWDTLNGIVDEFSGRQLCQIVPVCIDSDERDKLGELLAKKINDDLDSGDQWTTL